MVERLISFAGSDSGLYGAVALTGAAEAGESVASAFVGGPDGSVGFEQAEVSRGEGTLRLASDGEELILGLAAQTSPLGFETGPSRSLTVQAVGASAELSGPGADTLGSGFEATGVSWVVQGEADQALLRTAWSALADGSLLVLFALRPAGADNHGEETVGAARIGRDGSVTPYAEPLLSTEYDAEGAHTRATLELWGPDEDEGVPATRGAGTRELGGRSRLGGGELAAARFGWRLDAMQGFGGYEIFKA